MLRGIHHVSLFVTDLERSLAFYVGVLGCELVRRDDAWGGIFLGEVCGLGHRDLRIHLALLRVPGDATIFELIEVLDRGLLPTDASERGHGIARLGFEVTDIEATVASLRVRGVRFLSGITTSAVPPGQHYAGGRAIKFLDPDGIVLELQEPRQPGAVASSRG